MHNGLNPGVVVLLATAAYLGLLGLVIYLLVRRRRRQMGERATLIAGALEAAGGRHVGAGVSGGVYRGTEQEYDLGGTRVFSNNYSVNRYYYRVNLRVASGPLPLVTVYPEGAVQRFGKAIGLNREVQTGDKAFDDAAYIDTIEDDAPVQRMFESAAAREAVRALLDVGYKVTLSERGLEAFRLFPHGTAPDVSRLAEAAVLLEKMAAALPRLDRATFRGKITFLTARALFLFLGWIPFVILGGVIDGVFDSPGARTLSSGNKGLIVLLGAATAWVLYMALVVMRVRGRSYALPIVAIVGFFGLLGIPLAGVTSVLALNQALDGSPATEHAAQVIRTSKYKGDCRLHLASWVTPGAEQGFPIKCKLLTAFPKGSTVQVREHPGSLGMPWIEKIRAPE